MVGWKWRGMDLSNVETVTDEELDEYRSFTRTSKSFGTPHEDFWFANRPPVAKRKFLTIFTADGQAGRAYQIRNTLAVLHYYAIVAYRDGILFATRTARHEGATKGHVLDTLSIAYTHAHAIGLNAVAEVGQQYLEEWHDGPPTKQLFPDGWTYDPEAFASGLDFGNPVMSEAEKKLLVEWYEKNVGELPGYVRLLLRFRPNFLKAHRCRFETAIEAMPKQMMPHLMVHYNVVRGFPEGIREGVLLGRTFGMRPSELVDAMCRAASMAGGPDSLSIAENAAGDVLETMSED